MKPRILVLTTTFPGRPNDGTPRFVADLAYALADEFDIVVLTPHIPGIAGRETDRGVEIHRFRYGPERFETLADGAILANLEANPLRLLQLPLLTASMWWHTFRLLRSFRPDAVHAHWSVPTGLIASLFPSSIRRPVLITSHGVDLHALQRQPLEFVRKLALRRAAAVTTVSDELAARVFDISGLRDVPVIPMGATLDDLDAVEQTERRPNEVLYVGRLADKKGVEVLLEALTLLPKMSATIIGDGPLRSSLVTLAETLGVQDRARFLGQQQRDDVMTAMDTATVLAIPSVTAPNGDREGTPVVLAEAIAHKIPIVASRLGGLGEQLDDETGWLVPEGDALALAEALGRAVDEPNEAARRAKAAHVLVLPNLDLRETTRRYAGLLNDIVHR